MSSDFSCILLDTYISDLKTEVQATQVNFNLTITIKFIFLNFSPSVLFLAKILC